MFFASKEDILEKFSINFSKFLTCQKVEEESMAIDPPVQRGCYCFCFVIVWNEAVRHGSGDDHMRKYNQCKQRSESQKQLQNGLK